jgi:hypothetical protein
MDALQRLLDIEAIKQLKARYWRCIDTKSFDELSTVFAEDAVFDYRQAVRDPVSGTPEGVAEQEPVKGLQNIIREVGSALEVAQSAHQGHMPEIEILSETTAKGMWPFEDFVLNGDFEFKGYGHYVEAYEKIDGAWRIKHSEITRLRVVILQQGGQNSIFRSDEA